MADPGMADPGVTRILDAAAQGDVRVPPLSCSRWCTPELRKLAAQRMAQEAPPGQTLQATALVHDAYLRPVEVDHPQQWRGRGHFTTLQRFTTVTYKARSRRAPSFSGAE
jgi:hypothetical protein